jgi:hypothetical protein
VAYSDFDLRKIETAFNFQIVENKDLFSYIDEITISDFLNKILAQNVPLAQALSTEKARSELIIVNIFLELKNNLNIGLFSGLELNVDKEKGLNGFCDFLISQSPEQLFLKAPVITTVEAKNENIIGGLGQCVAEMIAARIFNERENNNIPKIYGIVTTGHLWKFIKLQDNTVSIDRENYYIKTPDNIMGILSAMVQQTA